MTTDPVQSTRSRGRRRRPQARAEDLRAAALALFVERGFEATRTEDITERAGVSKGTLYLYYPSKEKLLEAAVASAALTALDLACPAAQGDGSVADRLRRRLSDLWTHLQHDAVAGALKLAIAESRRFPQIVEAWRRSVATPAHRSIAEMIVQGIDRSEFRKLDPGVAAHSLLLPMWMCCLHLDAIDEVPRADRCLDEAFMSQHVELVLRGLCHDPEADSPSPASSTSVLRHWQER